MTTATLPRRTGSTSRAAAIVVAALLLLGAVVFIAHLRSTPATVPAKQSVTVPAGGNGASLYQHYYRGEPLSHTNPVQPLAPDNRGRIGADF
jgi:hypothetical protein